jgi:hypothetical protein
VAVVEMFAALKREFLPDLEVRDEGTYWEARNLPTLIEKMAQVRAAIDTFAQQLVPRPPATPHLLEGVAVATASLIRAPFSRGTWSPAASWHVRSQTYNGAQRL